MEKISVLIPVYNAEKYIGECLESILNQSVPAFEIVIVDDGSTDGTGKICESYAENHPFIKVVHKENGGSTSARERAIDEASGDYLVFSDSDDTLKPYALKSLCDAIGLYSADAVIYGADETDACGNAIGRFPVPPFREGMLSNKADVYDALLLTYSINSMCLKCMKRELFSGRPGLTGFEGLCYGDDLLESVYPLMKAERICYIDRPLYNYRTHSGMTGHYSSAFYDSYKKVNLRTKELLSAEGLPCLSEKAGIHLLRFAYGAVIRFRHEKKTDISELLRISGDTAFRNAYEASRHSGYSSFLTKKEKLVTDLLYKKCFGILSVLISAQRVLDSRNK